MAKYGKSDVIFSLWTIDFLLTAFVPVCERTCVFIVHFALIVTIMWYCFCLSSAFVVHVDIECRPELSYFFAFKEDRRTFLTTNSKSFAESACRNRGGQLPAQLRYYSNALLQSCYSTLLEAARVHDPNVNIIRNFGPEGAASATTPSIILCQSKCTGVELADVCLD